MINSEYELILRAKHLISLKMSLDEWKEYRLKEFNENKNTPEEDEIDLDKLKYVFEDIETIYIHKQKI